jgi:hypothetical protein
LIPKPGATLNIGEQKGYRSTWQLGHFSVKKGFQES